MTDEIRKKAEYCLNCKLKPCSKNGCPLNNDIPTFIKQLKEEKYEVVVDKEIAAKARVGIQKMLDLS